jgi:hypothetical protein
MACGAKSSQNTGKNEATTAQNVLRDLAKIVPSLSAFTVQPVADRLFRDEQGAFNVAVMPHSLLALHTLIRV